VSFGFWVFDVGFIIRGVGLGVCNSGFRVLHSWVLGFELSDLGFAV
jgi:hypothetical protein